MHKFSSLVEDLARNASTRGNVPALISLSDGETENHRWTHLELYHRAARIAEELRSLGLSPGDRAVLMYEPDIEFFAAFFGCLLAGVIAVPTYPPLDEAKHRSLPRLKGIVSVCTPKIILVSHTVLEAARMIGLVELLSTTTQWLETDTLTISASPHLPSIDISSEHPAMLQFTSGSTSDPKGVIITHGNLAANMTLLRQYWSIQQDYKFVSWCPLYHDMGLIAGGLEPLCRGGTSILMPPTAFLLKPTRWLHALSKYRGQLSVGPNFAFELCIRRVKEDELAQLDLSCVERITNAAEPIRPSTIRNFNQKFGVCGLKPEAVATAYGLAEATLIVSGTLTGKRPTIQGYDEEALSNRQLKPANNEKLKRELVSSGEVSELARISIVDPVSRAPCPEGQVGEIWVSGPCLAKGYWNNENATQATFVTSPKGHRHLRTGDLGALWDGNLYVVGRIKDVIIIDGVNHYPQDIELTVEHSNPAVRPGCIAAFSVDDPKGEKLVIVVEVERRLMPPNPSASNPTIPRSNAGDSGQIEVRSPPNFSDVEAHIRRDVALHHGLSILDVAFIRPRSILKTSSGKIQRSACRNAWMTQQLLRIQGG